MRETQESISQWARETFGPEGSNLSVIVRANEEMAELLACLARDDNDPSAAEEAADILIIFMRLFDRLGVKFWDEVERKMAVNRGREWELTGTGHGYHK